MVRKMRANSILYHDVICNGNYEASGFKGPGAAVYKVERTNFERHLAAIAQLISHAPVTVLDLVGGKVHSDPILLTFDDGGVSAITLVADCLDQYKWTGHFLITTNRIGSSTFVNRQQIRDLQRRGHVVGSHTHSHPMRMSKCAWRRLIEEWRTSTRILSDILGEQVRVASVPGGYYSKIVAEAAASEGIQALFTSEPTRSCHFVKSCLVLGRYTVRRTTQANVTAGFASGKVAPRVRQWLLWKAMQIPKFVGGERWLSFREAWLSR
jgi:peptidoglycan/xylan/chitin deacetylase (PgdA/CDA1 family)